MSKHNIELAIKSTQSMGQAGLYMGVSKNTFKKYAKLHGLWAPIKSSKGIRHTGNVGSALKHDLKAILGGKKSKPIQRRYTAEKRYTRGIFEMCVFKLFSRLHPYERNDSIATTYIGFFG